ncbi:uncharacterized protein LOC123424540 [Hordeum vulgare subsp. vulgare]|uniref:uncharacterized protein LOC123424540 n=1 Tax=Hordeum vulgare subsp. vulgare TaxID=112509 RepID=UPI001D1A4031|nr:uncharacterized protein LOC123424540 [Hordeum vulgare subsp. vulgare]
MPAEGDGGWIQRDETRWRRHQFMYSHPESACGLATRSLARVAPITAFGATRSWMEASGAATGEPEGLQRQHASRRGLEVEMRTKERSLREAHLARAAATPATWIGASIQRRAPCFERVGRDRIQRGLRRDPTTGTEKKLDHEDELRPASGDLNLPCL